MIASDRKSANGLPLWELGCCTGWAGTGSAPAGGEGANTGSFAMSEPSSVTWYWKKQYLLTITPTDKGDPRGAGWYDKETLASWSVTNPWPEDAEDTRYRTDTDSGAVLMDAPKTVTVDWITQYKLTTSVSPAGSGTVGIVPESDDGWYDDGQSITLTAFPYPGWCFSEWGPGGQPWNQIQFPLTEPAEFIAHFIGVQITDDAGHPITTLQTTIVGKKIALRGNVFLSPPTLYIASQQWSIPGSTVKSYTQTVAKGEKQELTTVDKQQDNIAFYWIDGAQSLTVTYTIVTSNGKSCSATATFDINRPTATLTSVTTTSVPAVAVSDPDPTDPMYGLELHFGTIALPGITWTGTVTTPANGAGEIAFVQRINTFRDRIRDDATGTFERRSSNYKYILDDYKNAGVHSVQYAGASVIGANQTRKHIRGDTPGQTLVDVPLKDMYCSDWFELYLLYKPSGTDSIWVTLQMLWWDWRGRAIKDTTTGVWSLDDSCYTQNPIGQNSTILPTWSDYFTHLTWIPY